MTLAALSLASFVNAAGGILLLAGALAALLTTPRRAELRRQRGTIEDLRERLDGIEKQLTDERTRRVVAETAAAAAADRAAHVETFAVGRTAYDEILHRLDRLAVA